MGMSIDEAIPILHDMYNYYNDVDIDAYIGFDNEDNNAIETALDTMRKYQKIQEIHKKWFCDYTSAEAYTKISEVLKNGNDN